MDWLQDAFAYVLVFLGGLLAPAIGNAINATVSARLGSAAKAREQVDARTRLAAEQCFEELNKLPDLIPAYAAAERSTSTARASDSDYQSLREIRALHNSAIAGLEANIVLLPQTVREEMLYLLNIIRYAYDLPYRTNPTSQTDVGWHPDRARNIAAALVGHARKVLASHLTNSPLPPRPDSVIEYALAIDDRNDELNDYFSDFIEEDEAAVQKFREDHGLPENRRAIE